MAHASSYWFRDVEQSRIYMFGCDNKRALGYTMNARNLRPLIRRVDVRVLIDVPPI